MTWYPYNLPKLEPVVAAGRILTASLLARGAANVVAGSNTVLAPQNRTQGRSTLSRSKTMRAQYKKKYVKKEKVATVSAVRKMIMGNLETKRYTGGPAFTAGMVDNSVYTHNLTARLVAGTGETNRLGEEVSLQSIQGTFTFAASVTAGAYQCRFLILYSGEEVDPSNTQFSTGGLAGPNVFMNNGLGFTTGVTNPKAAQILYDRLLEVNSNISGATDIQSVRFNVNLRNLKFKYQEATSAYGKTKNLYLVCVARSLNAAGPPAIIGVPYCNVTLGFKDP
jgi:hypothetical protein